MIQQYFDLGNSAYKEGKYEEAIENYEKVSDSGLESGNIYYNLGNSYFKKGKSGKAVFNYEKAFFFMPSDNDLMSNYEYVLASLNLDLQYFGTWPVRFANVLFEGATIDLLTVLLSAIYFLAVALLICSLFFPGLKRGINVFLLFLSVVFALSAVSLNSKITYLNKGAIVISKVADARFEPTESGTTYFKLTEGGKVEILEKNENWYKIKRPDNKMGWVQKTDVGSLSE